MPVGTDLEAEGARGAREEARWGVWGTGKAKCQNKEGKRKMKESPAHDPVFQIGEVRRRRESRSCCEVVTIEGFAD